VGVDHVEASAVDEPPQRAHPPDLGPAAVGPEAVHRHPLRFEVADQGVLPRQDVGDLHLEAPGVDVPDRVDEQPLGAASAEALGEPQHPPGPTVAPSAGPVRHAPPPLIEPAPSL
jgi:hypothetical protein